MWIFNQVISKFEVPTSRCVTSLPAETAGSPAEIRATFGPMELVPDPVPAPHKPFASSLDPARGSPSLVIVPLGDTGGPPSKWILNIVRNQVVASSSTVHAQHSHLYNKMAAHFKDLLYNKMAAPCAFLYNKMAVPCMEHEHCC